MATTYEKIATTTLGSAATNIDFTSISGSYTDLRCVFVVKGATAGDAQIRFNSDTATNYSCTDIYGNGSTATSARRTSQTKIELDQDAFATNQVVIYEIDIFSYAGSTNKTLLYKWSADNNGSGYVQNGVGLWRSTSAITSISFFAATNSLAAGSIATIYGIKAA